MTFDTVFERSYPPNTTMSERDKNTANRIARQLTTEGVFYEGRLRQLTDEIVTALTTARKEARAAAFKDMFKVLCPDCAEGDEPILDQQARWCYHGEGNQQVGCSASKLRIEAAVSTDWAQQRKR